MADLIADARSAAKASFRSTFDERRDEGWLQVQVELLREILESREFVAAMQRIVNYPHEELEQEAELIPVDRPFKWTARSVRSLVHSPVRRALPRSHPLRSATGLDSVATKVPAYRRTPTTDTAENRFVKHALQDLFAFLGRAEEVFENAGASWAPAHALARRLSRSLDQWLARPFFKNIGELRGVPLGSPVLQRKAGYRELLQWWLRFRTAAELSWKGGEDAFKAGQRNVADIYEYWLFFGLLDWFCSRFNQEGQAPTVEKLIDGLDGESPSLRLKRKVPLGPFTGRFSGTRRSLHASFDYNRAFEVVDDRAVAGSWSRSMHPDYTLSFWPSIEGKSAEEALEIAEEQELLVHIHLDAKYRVNSLKELFGSGRSAPADGEVKGSPGNYKRQDLLKMHAYRDAIRRSEGAYILYPGDDGCRAGQHLADEVGPDRWPQVMRGFHEIIPGLGAFAIAPDEKGEPKGIDGAGHLSGFLDDVLENLCNRASFRERRTSYLYEPLREHRSLTAAGEDPDTGSFMLQEAPELDSDGYRIPAASDITVLVAWYDGPQEKEWMLDNNRAVIRLGQRRGTLPLVKALSDATHILLHGRGRDTVAGLREIRPDDPGIVLTRAELAAEGFPTDPGKDENNIFAVFTLSEVVAYPHFNWDSASLEKALTRFLNRLRPASKKKLEKLGREFPKPHLVSLADLQLALASSGDKTEDSESRKI